MASPLTVYEANARSRLKREMAGKEYVENELLDLLTDPAEKNLDRLMLAQTMRTELMRSVDAMDADTRILLRKARKLLRHARQEKVAVRRSVVVVASRRGFPSRRSFKGVDLVSERWGQERRFSLPKFATAPRPPAIAAACVMPFRGWRPVRAS
jgi:hypothetical protein